MSEAAFPQPADLPHGGICGHAAPAVSEAHRSLVRFADIWSHGVGDEDVSFAALRSGDNVRWVVGPRSAYVLLWLRAGSARVSGVGVNLEVAAGSLVVLSANDRYDVIMIGARLNLVRVSDRFVEQVQLADWDPNIHAGQQPESRGESGDVLQRLAKDAWSAFHVAEKTGAVRARAKKQLAIGLLRASPRPSGSAFSPRFDAAVQFMQDHAADAITMTDVAGAVGMSLRGLQQVFQRENKGTPQQRLRSIRLEAARNELFTTQDLGVTVAEIAAAWRLRHVGRFAGEYLARFGEHPSETLRQQRRNLAAERFSHRRVGASNQRSGFTMHSREDPEDGSHKQVAKGA